MTAPTTEKTYRFSSLESQHDIRLLFLHPGHADQPLSGSLWTVNIDDVQGRYHTISYVWGDPDFPHTICFGAEGVLRITKSLFHALRCFRSATQDMVLWVDAVCINQSSTDERNHQVRMMGKIYSRCIQCLAYLGEEAHGSQRVPDILVSVGTIVGSRVAFETGSSLRFTCAQSDLEGMPGKRSPKWTILRKFFQRPWFRRIWVLQEAVLSPELILFCGSWVMAGEDLYTFRMLHDKCKPDLLMADFDHPDYPNLHMSWFLIGAQWRYRLYKGNVRMVDLNPQVGERNETLHHVASHDIFFNCEYAEATNPLDLFYGILGIPDGY